MFKFKLIFTWANRFLSIHSQAWLFVFSHSCDNFDLIFSFKVSTLVARIVFVQVHDLVQFYVYSFPHILQEHFMFMFLFIFMFIFMFMFIVHCSLFIVHGHVHVHIHVHVHVYVQVHLHSGKPILFMASCGFML